MTITQAQAEETLGQIDVVEKLIKWQKKKPFTEAQKPKKYAWKCL